MKGADNILRHISFRDLADESWLRSSLYFLRHGFETPGDALELSKKKRMGKPGYGERSEQKLQEIASLRWLSEGPRRKLRSEIGLLAESPEDLCSTLLERRKHQWAPEEPLFNHLAALALQAAGLEHLWQLAQKTPTEPRLAGDERAGRPMGLFDPRPPLGVRLGIPRPPEQEEFRHYRDYSPLPEDKRHWMDSSRESRSWPRAESDVYEVARIILAPTRWTSRAAARLVPSWVLCRRIVERTSSLLVRRRAARAEWDSYRDPCLDPDRLRRPGHDQVGEEALWEEVGRLAALGPGWPLSTGAFAREETFEDEFLGSLERIGLRDARIIQLRLAVGRSQGLILKQVGERLGLSAERVRQREEEAWESFRRREFWPGRLRGRLRTAWNRASGPLPLAELSDGWLTARALYARPFFDLLVKRLMGSRWRVVLRQGEPCLTVRPRR